MKRRDFSRPPCWDRRLAGVPGAGQGLDAEQAARSAGLSPGVCRGGGDSTSWRNSSAAGTTAVLPRLRLDAGGASTSSACRWITAAGPTSDPYKLDEKVLGEIDRAVELGKKHQST